MIKHQEDKYYLKTLHDEIDLFDRKLAHLLKYQAFDTDAERETAAQKMTDKRATLVETAKRLAAQGIEFKDNELPRSFRPKDAPLPVSVTIAEPVAVATKTEAQTQSSAAASATAYWQKTVQEYLLKKGRK